jgi:4'-phosphopantetheinyl transferase
MLPTCPEEVAVAETFLWPSAPARPMLRVGEVHVWAASLEQSFASMAALEELLSPAERNRADRYRVDRERRRYVVAHGILRRVLAGYRSGDPRTLRFTTGKRGKPALSQETGPTAIRFNLAHAEEVALIAVTLDREIGVDIERVQPMSELDSIVENFFSRRERDTLRGMETTAKENAFYRCWTRKESYAKAVDDCLSVVLRGFDTMPSPARAHLPVFDAAQDRRGGTVHELLPAEGYVGAVAIDGPVRRLSTWRWTEVAPR